MEYNLWKSVRNYVAAGLAALTIGGGVAYADPQSNYSEKTQNDFRAFLELVTKRGISVEECSRSMSEDCNGWDVNKDGIVSLKDFAYSADSPQILIYFKISLIQINSQSTENKN